MQNLLDTRSEIAPRWKTLILAERIQHLLSVRNTRPNAAGHEAPLRLPLAEIQRLAETSPHLLADIGLEAATDAKADAPWRLSDGRSMVLLRR